MTEIQRDMLVQTLTQLIKIPSVNPDLVPGASGERELAIVDRLGRTPGIKVEVQEVANGRPNVIATVGRSTGKTLMLNGHMDTVTVEGMTDPFTPRLDAGRLYGRGAVDMKGALAGLIVLLEEVARAGDFPGTLIGTFVVDEEYASIGTSAICREIDRWQPDAAIVLEQTNLGLGVAHKGFVWAEILTQGVAAHGSYWEVGVDAIAMMGRVIVALDQLSRDLISRPHHPIVGPPSLHSSLISGGQELSSYPVSCRLQIERRTIPGETAEQVEAELTGILDRLATDDPAFSARLAMGLVRQPFEISEDATIAQAISHAVESVLGARPALSGHSGWMDSALLADAGVPTAIFGPGGDGAHGHVEYVDLDSLVSFTQVLARAAYDFCAGE